MGWGRAVLRGEGTSHRGGFSRRKAWALQRSGFSSCGPGALEHRLNSRGAWAQLIRSMWDLPRSETEPVFPAMASRFFTAEPPGKPLNLPEVHMLLH